MIGRKMCFRVRAFLAAAVLASGGVLLLPGRAHADDTLADAYAFPVPFRPSVAQDITFTNIPAVTTIKIFTVSGKIVRKLTESDGDGLLKWNVKNEDGAPVASGVYIYLIESGGQRKRGKLLIIR